MFKDPVKEEPKGQIVHKRLKEPPCWRFDYDNHHHYYLLIARLHDCNVKPPNVTFYGGLEHISTNFLFTFSAWIESF